MKVQIKITLVNSFGENSYSQRVIVYPNVDPTSPDLPVTDEPATDEPTQEQPSEEIANTAEVEGSNDDSAASEDGQITSIDSVTEIKPDEDVGDYYANLTLMSLRAQEKVAKLPAAAGL